MAMQTNLSKKDKMTIGVLLFAGAIFMIIWFLIKPTVTSIITLNDKIEQAETKQTQYKAKIMYLTSGEALYYKAVDDLNESTAEFYEIMDSSEIDRMVTSYTLKAGLFSENLTIKMPNGTVDEAPYVFSPLYTEATGRNNSSNSSSNQSTNNAGTDTLLTPYNTARAKSTNTTASGVQCVSLTLVVTGKREVCQSFIDDICTKDAVRITGFTWSKVDPIEVYNEETGRYERRDPGTIRLTINFNLYMADIADYDIAVSE